ncbi:hypothetical protein [Phenylobacterium deserti]|uniref:Uncharacterized protein n=1 Tax=Phenylobacterium deserti TaxID=1914756 RepID=A0A328AGJ9_9CAUL|nr:hypothetical protein [Phenylobacterium deserti]RAK52574.1 hypothetical protein DJ018_10200 [Phenylobacterium deserti]
MATVHHINSTHASISYAALRHGGEPPARARSLLGLDAIVAGRLERLFQTRGRTEEAAMRPKFARCEAHVAAVLREGGFPALVR